MKIAVTNHAVERYLERVEGAKGFEREPVRQIIRDLVDRGFAEGAVRDHPYDPARRIVPFKSGKSIMYLSIGPNLTNYEADVAVIGVLFERELTGGKQSLGVQLGDVAPALASMTVREPAPKFVVFIGKWPTIEYYGKDTLKEIDDLVSERGVERNLVRIYKIIE
jgi:hypothetical protein